MKGKHDQKCLPASPTLYVGAFAAVILLPIVANAQLPAANEARTGERTTAVGMVLDTLLPGWIVRAIGEANPDVLARRVAVTAAQARVRATQFTSAAVLTADLEDAASGRLGDASIRVGLERELLSRRRRQAARTLAETELRAAEAAIRVTEQRAIAAALRGLTQAVAWRAVAARQASQDSLLASAEGSLRARFAVGNARYVDVLRVRTERLRVQAERAASVSDARAGALALVALLTDGSGPARGISSAAATLRIDSLLASRSPYGLRAVLPSLPDADSLLASSGILALLDAEVAQAAASRALLAAGLRPQVVAGVGMQRVSGDGGGLGPTAGIAVTLPFTARRGNAAALSAADQVVRAAEISRRATLNAVRSTLAVQRERYEAARVRLGLFDAALLRGARDERESALAAYRAGDLSLLELLDFERALSNVEIERTRAMVDAAGALADLISSAAGVVESLRGDLPPFVQVSNER